MNKMSFQDLVKGQYGRKVAYANVDVVDENNILSVLAKCIGTFNYNKTIIKYLWDYKNGDQPIRYRKKTIRDDIKNTVVENHAWEIVRFKNGQTYGEPIQVISLVNDEKINKTVELLNRYLMVGANKQKYDIDSGEWTSAVGTGYKAILKTNDANMPFKIVVPNPMNTFIIYSSITGERLLSVQELKDENDVRYYSCFSKEREFKVQNSKLLPYSIDNQVVYSRKHFFGDIPIVEYPNNQSRISDIELVIDLLDAINNMQSNRMDSIEQFVQSWVKFINCEIDAETFQQMKMSGALVVKSNNGSDNKADVDIMTQELNQTQAQVAKDDLMNNMLSISAIPNKQGNTGGDTQGAVELRNGWDFAKQAARLKDPYIIEGEKQLCELAINLIQLEKGKEYMNLSPIDYKVQITHSPQDNMQVKAQVFQMLVSSGIHPLIAIETCGLWGDAEKVFLMSKPYLDVLHKTIDDVVADADTQRAKAQELVNKNNEGNQQ